MRSELVTAVRRDDIDMASACRDPAVRMDELLDCLDSPRGSLKNFDLEDTVEKTLEVSLKSFEPDVLLLPVARRKRLVTPDANEDLDCIDGERVTSTWKLDNGRAGAVNQIKSDRAETVTRCLPSPTSSRR